MNTEKHVINALQSAKILRNPFPHFYAQNIFPPAVYSEIQQILATKSDFHSEKFKNRVFADELGLPQVKFMHTEAFAKAVLRLFFEDFREKYEFSDITFFSDLRLIRDQQHYKIGPHTDAPHKVISLLFYLPPDDTHAEYGTSIYTPIWKERTCEGGPHYNFEPFTKIWTAPFSPNTCFGFWKTNKSFHGVEPIPVQFQRDVLLYNIYRQG